MDDFLFRGKLEGLDPAVSEITKLEAERQFRKLILIPSESTSPLAVREALASAFQNIYAEGYPNEETRLFLEEEILDHEARLADYRRYSDPRYYKGVEYADTIEMLARRRCAETFAANGYSADEIYVNVQPLSGAPANNAVYHALIEPGATVMGMNLLHGGHLTHGSPVNRSGKYYNIVHYGVDPETERIDYDKIHRLAEEHHPKLIIAGFSSYPWSADWAKFREIADSVGAYLLADIAHVAGLVAAKVHPSPVGIADVITFTTHKSLCGPRGAAILCTNRGLARRIDRAVFPGEQGGPHMNTIAAQALAFKLAQSEQFRELQKRIVANCKLLAEGLQDEGFRIPFGGTNSHMMNVDVTSIKGPDAVALSGDQAARILDLAGIAVNRNTIPGDLSAANPSGIRLGTTWVTQRGFGETEMIELVEVISSVLKGSKPYGLTAGKGILQRAKINFQILNEARLRVRDLAQEAGIDFEPSRHGYPHFYYLDDPAPAGPFVEVQIQGEKASDLLRWATSSRPEELEEKEVIGTSLKIPGRTVVGALAREAGKDGWLLTLPAEDAPQVAAWLRDLSDGFVTVDPEDLHKKLPGPAVVRMLGGVPKMPKWVSDPIDSTKPWYVGIPTGEGEPLPDFDWQESEEALRRTALYETHKAMGAKIIPFAGWEMPVWYSSVIEEHVATREAAGLFDVSHMGVFQVEGSQACAFLDSVAANDVASLAVGESLYTHFLSPDGAVIDDTMVYRRRDQAFLVVVNAANARKDWDWLSAVNEGVVCVDRQRPWARALGRGCRLRNLRDPMEGEEMRVDLALQGPKSREILLALGCDRATAARLKTLKWAGIMEGQFGDIDLIVSRTGYTGERVAYELFVHPSESVALWEGLWAVGEERGLKPVGLGARDSLRTEAGLPLYGHEMAGERGLGVGDAGFSAYVKTYKPWFIGRSAYLEQERTRKSEVTRFRFDARGVRMAHYGDPVVEARGRVIGFVTSCAVDREGYLLGQANLLKRYTEVGTPIGIYQSASKRADKAPAQFKLGDRVNVPSSATVLSRFPK